MKLRQPKLLLNLINIVLNVCKHCVKVQITTAVHAASVADDAVEMVNIFTVYALRKDKTRSRIASTNSSSTVVVACIFKTQKIFQKLNKYF